MMKARVMVMTVVLAAMAGGVRAQSSIQSQAPLAHTVPVRSMAYVGWSGKTLQFSGSMFGQLLDSDQTAAMLSQVKSGIASKIDEDVARQAFQDAWSLAGIAWKHPMAAALVDLDPQAQTFAVLVTIDLEQEADDFSRHLDSLIAQLFPEVEITRRTAQGVAFTRLAIDEVPIWFGQAGSRFILTVGSDTLAGQVVSLGLEGSLAGSERFVEAMAAVGGQSVQAACYADVPALLDLARRAGPKAGLVVAALGLDKATALAGTTRIVDRGMYSRTKLLSPAPHRGLLLTLAGEPLSDEDLAGAPADTLYAGAFNLSPAQLLDEVRRVAAAIDPNALDIVNGALSQASQVVGVSIEDDILSNMADTWTVVSAPSLGGVLTGTVLSVELSDAEAFAPALQTVVRNLLHQLGPDGERMMKSYEHRRATVNYLHAWHRYTPISPAWAVAGGKLHIAAWPQVLEASLAQDGAAGLTGRNDFANTRKHLSDRASMLSWTDLPATTRIAYPIVLFANSMLSGVVEREGIDIAPDWLPNLPEIEEFLWPTGSAVSSDEGGIVFESYGSLPGGGLLSGGGFLSPTSFPLMVSALAPGFGRARHLARRAKSVTNVKGIASGIMIYNVDHGSPPADLAAVVEENMISAGLLASPSGPDGEIRLVDGSLEGPVAYTYIHYQEGFESVENPSSAVMIYEDPSPYNGEGTVVGFVDGHVEFVDMHRFRRLLEAVDNSMNEEW